MSLHREREISFEVGERWALPDLQELVPEGGRIVTDQADLDAGYLDTETQVLRRLGVTLRRRTGGSDAGWHLKIPHGSARLEVQSKSRGRWVPAGLAEPLSGVLNDRALRQVATISTDRRTLALRDADDQLLVELADDHVTATAGEQATPQRWREIEAELGPAGNEGLLKAVTKLVTKAGARRSAIQVKLDRALGPLPAVGAGSAALVTAYVTERLGEVLRGDIALRMGTDPEAVSELVAAISRLRAVLRGYRRSFDSDPTTLAEELHWLEGVLGGIRELDVLAEIVAAELAELPDELVLGPVRAGLEEAVAADRAAAIERWHEERDGERYRRLLTNLVDWLHAVPVGEHAQPRTKRVLKQADRELAHRLAEADRDPKALLRARDAAAQLRYTAELATADHDRAARTAKRAKKGQRLIRTHADQLVAAEYLRGLGARYGTQPGHNGFTYGLLAARASRHAADVWRRLES